MSKPSDERSTPKEFFDLINKEFSFNLDVCANENNHKVERYYSLENNALFQPWAPWRCWMNPPYSELPTWLEKAEKEAKEGALVVGLLPVDTSTKWFHRYIWPETPYRSVRFLKKRLKFDNDNSAKFANMLVIWLPGNSTLW